MSVLTSALAMLEAELRDPDGVRREVAAMPPAYRARVANAAWRLGVLAEPRQDGTMRRGPVLEHRGRP